MDRKTTVHEHGTALVLVAILTFTSVGLTGAFLTTSLSKVKHVRQHEAELSAFNAAESGLAMAIESAWAVYQAAPPGQRFAALETHLGEDGEDGGEPQAMPPGPLMNRTDLRELIAEKRMGRSRTRVYVRGARFVPDLYADIEFVSVGWNAQAARTAIGVVRFANKTSKVFDSAYFINNFGWLWGGGITVNGSVRANGNFSIRSATVNGDVYASENEDLGAAGVISGTARTKTIKWYNRHYGEEVRPTNPSATPEDANGNGILDPGEDRNGNGKLDDFDYVGGYDGESEYFEHLPTVEMPYLGDLSTYRALAEERKGTIRQGGRVIVDGVLGDDGVESVNLAIVGTEEEPIVIDGPVVIENDVVLKGYITGQGTIYAGRNVHIVGDVKYVNPPRWPKPLENGDEVRAENQTRDLVGFCAKGSIILGDYTKSSWRSVTRRYQRPPFTQAYVVDETDAVNGYVTHYDATGRPMFHGNYTSYDGGTREEVIRRGRRKGQTTYVSRRYYESSLSDKAVRAIADNQVRHIDGVLYTNHLLSGKIGRSVFNGALVARDEAIIYRGSVGVNYDVRVRFSEYEFLDAFLPREPSRRTLFFRQEL